MAFCACVTLSRMCALVYYVGLPPGFGSQDYKPPVHPPCIIEKLCDLHDGLIVEAKGIKEHYWKPYIKKLFERKVSKMDCTHLNCTFTPYCPVNTDVCLCYNNDDLFLVCKVNCTDAHTSD